MNQKILVICQSQHQLEKAKYLKKFSMSIFDIAYIGPVTPEHNKLFLEDADVYACSSQINVADDRYEKFIFFSMVPSKKLFNLIYRIRKINKVIIAIQETHQLGMHLGVINSLIFCADVIFTASDLEKKIFISDGLQANAKIYSVGWLFQKQYNDFLQDDLHKQVFREKEDYVLIIFSAPNNITSSSQEDFETRRAILNFARQRFQNLKLLLKLHPLEDQQLFKKFVDDCQFSNVNFVDTNKSLITLAEESSCIISSDKTQAFIDLSRVKKELLLYQLGKENFITSYLNTHQKPEEINGVKIFSIKQPIKDLKLFRELHCKSDNTAMSEFLQILKIHRDVTTSDNGIEMAAWSSIYQNKHDFQKVIVGGESDLARSLQFLFIPNATINFTRLHQNINSVSIRSAITLIVIDFAVNKNLIATEDLVKFIDLMFTPHMVQYFYLEALRFEFWINHKSLSKNISTDTKTLLQNTKFVLAKKSLFFQGIFALERYAKNLDTKIVQKGIYWLLDILLRTIKTIKN